MKRVRAIAAEPAAMSATKRSVLLIACEVCGAMSAIRGVLSVCLFVLGTWQTHAAPVTYDLIASPATDLFFRATLTGSVTWDDASPMYRLSNAVSFSFTYTRPTTLGGSPLVNAFTNATSLIFDDETHFDGVLGDAELTPTAGHLWQLVEGHVPHPGGAEALADGLFLILAGPGSTFDPWMAFSPAALIDVGDSWRLVRSQQIPEPGTLLLVLMAFMATWATSGRRATRAAEIVSRV